MFEGKKLTLAFRVERFSSSGSSSQTSGMKCEDDAEILRLILEQQKYSL